MTTMTNENTPVAGQGNKGKNESAKSSTTTQPTALNQTIVNTLFELIIDTKFRDRDATIIADRLTLEDVEQICQRFEIPLAEVLEIAHIGVKS